MAHNGRWFGQVTFGVVSLLALSACSNVSYVQRNSPANSFKDYQTSSQNQAAVIGMGQPISARQAAADNTITLTGTYSVADIMQRLAGTYNVAIRWGNGARRDTRKEVLMNKLTFDEARNYLEDVYDVQIIKEGERRLLVLPSASEQRLTEFNPGQDVTLSQAIRGLAEQCNYNLVINENREKLNSIRITTALKNVTCFDAFEALLNPHGLSLVNTGDYMTITGLPQRQWNLDLYEPQRNEEIEVNYASNFSADSGGASSSSSSGSSQSAGGSNKVTIKYERDLWKDLNTDLQELIKNNCLAPLDASSRAAGESATLLPPPNGDEAAGDPSLVDATEAAGAQPNETASTPTSDANRCGYVRINPVVGVIQMRAPRNVLDQADEIIQRVQDIASRRLMLEARVLAVTKSRGFNQGGSLNVGQSKDGVTTAAGFQGSVLSTINGVLASFTGSAGGVDTNFGGFRVQSNNLDALVGLIEQYGTTYQLMHPMMELMDRQRATLIDGVNQKYFVVRSTTDSSSGAVTTSTDVEERNQFLGLQFSAAAQISDNPQEPHTVAVQIPIISKVGDINIPSGVSGSIAGVAPIANTRLIDQKVRLRDGEIKAIGGLTTMLATDRESGVPVLRDIPALGKLVNNNAVEYNQVEFVILLQVRRLD